MFLQTAQELQFLQSYIDGAIQIRMEKKLIWAGGIMKIKLAPYEKGCQLA